MQEIGWQEEGTDGLIQMPLELPSPTRHPAINL